MLAAFFGIARGAYAEGMLANPTAGQMYAQPEITADLFPKMSRTFHGMNMSLMRAVGPAIEDYRAHYSPALHKGMQNFIKNLKEPLTSVHSILELDFSNAAASIGRFAINTTIGIAGMMDVAGGMGLKRDSRRMADTLGAWGAPMGGFFVLPLYAQTNTRDFAAGLAENIFDPMYLLIGVAPWLFLDLAGALLDLNDSYDFVMATDESALDSYETFKTFYLQNRKKEMDRLAIFGARPAEAGKTSSYDFDME